MEKGKGPEGTCGEGESANNAEISRKFLAANFWTDFCLFSSANLGEEKKIWAAQPCDGRKKSLWKKRPETQLR